MFSAAAQARSREKSSSHSLHQIILLGSRQPVSKHFNQPIGLRRRKLRRSKKHEDNDETYWYSKQPEKDRHN